MTPDQQQIETLTRRIERARTILSHPDAATVMPRLGHRLIEQALDGAMEPADVLTAISGMADDLRQDAALRHERAQNVASRLTAVGEEHLALGASASQLAGMRDPADTGLSIDEGQVALAIE